MAYLSLFSVLREGPGPSSVHTSGPFHAARRFVHELAAAGRLTTVARIGVELYGGAACAGRESGADAAIVAGLEGGSARGDAAAFAAQLEAASMRRTVHLAGRHAIAFEPDGDIGFRIDRALAYDGNALRFAAVDRHGARVADRVYLAVGDDIVLAGGEALKFARGRRLPYEYEASADALLRQCRQAGRKIAFVALANEGTIASPGEVRARLSSLRDAMRQSVARGLAAEGPLPSGRERTARALAARLDDASTTAAQRVTVFATAAAEENAAGGAVVAAPSHGAAGIIAALLVHAHAAAPPTNDGPAHDFLATAGTVGALLRRAGLRQAGCQGEVGLGAAMAAAGYASFLGATPAQALHAAELALKPHLGLACDPVASRVESPCIDRNGRAAAQALVAAQGAVRLLEPPVALDAVVLSMVESARTMAGRYKQASLGGVAMSMPDC